MTMMGGPIDTRRNPTSVNAFATERNISWFEDNVICRVPSKYPGHMRNVYPGFLQLAGFVSMNAERHFEIAQGLLLPISSRATARVRKRIANFTNQYNAVMDLPAEFYLDTIRMVFQEHQLARGSNGGPGQAGKTGGDHQNGASYD